MNCCMRALEGADIFGLSQDTTIFKRCSLIVMVTHGIKINLFHDDWNDSILSNSSK